MDCTPFLALLGMCTLTPEGPPTALSLADEKPAVVCMTKQQARAKYPKDWLYWHGSNRCWDNIPGRSHRARKPAPTSEPKQASNPKTVSVADASGNTVARRQARIEVFYPAVVVEQQAIANDLYTVAKPITEWPLMMDLDAAGPDPDNGIDGCCWPPLEQLLGAKTR
jgi:hypothetical protein